ncbi:hypothetical protein [Kitasatospora cineracea]|uniref:Uncharacterized protein n=1 Tax=Kitasatospora cineracea TaxID=88074 RepID=A0A3N4RI26_9ACTN|nr:hypothetical protein [Kitasatospora cineracea]RPE28017.1 hypothetical protein EDD38_7325 [Kitasatospora cineracea]
MTNTSTLDLILPGDEPDDDGQDYDGLSSPERETLAEAAGMGVRAAAWIRTLAERQGEEDNRRSLERYARAVERILSREIVTDRDGPLEGQLLYKLDAANFTIRLWNASGPMDLQPAEQVALAAIGAATASAPGLAANRALGADLPRVIALIGHAMAVGGPGCPR